jgi:hypothetical protein
VLLQSFDEVTNSYFTSSVEYDLAEIKEDFIVLRYTKDEQWEEFIIAEDYEAFLLTKKENKFFI